MPKVTGVVEAVNALRSGESSTGRPWTLYGVVIGGFTLTTFDGKWTDLVGAEATVEFETTQNGKYTNHKILESKHDVSRSKGPVIANTPNGHREVPTSGSRLDEIRDLLALILEELKARSF
jgi:hypothetical protein